MQLNLQDVRMARADKTKLALEQFLPYRLSVLTNLVSNAIADIYAARFDLTLPEWRVIAVLGWHGQLTATQIIDVTAMDKVTISRAVARLVKMKRLKSVPDKSDARRQLLSLSAVGEKIHAEIVPLALSLEQKLINQLPSTDQQQLDVLLAKLTEAARSLR
jgi:DNA-binding MarR family transcriptional regulator